MKGFKKIVVMAILTIMMALCSFGVVTTAFADDYAVSTTQVSVGSNSVETEVGKKERLTFIANGNSNVAGFNIIIVLPSNVTFSAFEIAENYQDANYQYLVNSNAISVVCNSNNDAYSRQTTLFYVEFIAREGGHGEVSFERIQLADVNANEIDCYGYSCTIVVSGEAQIKTLKGDVDGDNKVSLADLMLMQRFTIGSLGDEANFSTIAGDIDADGCIDVIDCQHIQRYLVGKISLEELQNLAGESDDNGGNEGSGNVPNPPMPNEKLVYNVHVGAELLKEALVIDYYNWNATFEYKGQTLEGTPCPISLIDENANDGIVAFVAYNSTEVYIFVLSGGNEVKLDEHYDLAEVVEQKPTNFDGEYCGEYIIINGGEQIGNVYINEQGVFTGFANIMVDGMYFSPQINGFINISEDGTAYAHVFGSIKKEIKFDLEKRAIIPLENGEEIGANYTFIINYDLGNGAYIVEEVTYRFKEGDDIEAVAKMLAVKNLTSGFVIEDYYVNYLHEGRYSIEVKVREENGNQGGETTEGKQIMLYMLVSDGKHEMLEPMRKINVASVEQLTQMIKGFTDVPEETGMTFVGLYVDRECKAPYTESMGINVNELYVVCAYDEDVNMVNGLGGTFSLLEQDDNGNKIALEGSLKIDEDKQTFELTIGDINAVKYTGKAIVVNKSYDANGNISHAQLSLITANNVQISGDLDINAGRTSTFTIHMIEDYSTYTSKEELKATAGTYTTYVMYDGIDMAKCDIILQDNGVFTLQMFFMKQIGYYEFNLDVTGKTTIVMTVQDDPMEGVIDFEKKEIYIVVVDNGPSVDVGGGENAGEYVATLVMVDYDVKTQVFLEEDSYEALKAHLFEMFDGQLENVNIYLDEAQTIKLTPDTFDTVNRTFYIVFDLSNVENGYENGYDNEEGIYTDKVTTIN